MKNKLRAWGVATASCLPLLEAAQAAKTEAPTVAPPLTYRSAFADYKPYRDVPLAHWREVNDIVARPPGGASGHAGHVMGGMDGMNGMEMPAEPAAPASAPRPKKTMPRHDGHHHQGGKP